MTWNPTHVQFTVQRARNLPTKGKGGAKLNDVFVTIHLGKEKFQTSTIKNALNPEWFEQCDLAIPHLNSEIQVHVMHRGMLTDDFIGYTAVPLVDYKQYERPRSQWAKLQGKPTKPPDGKYRGELEVRVSFHVKSKTDEALNAGVKKSSKSPSLKTLSNLGHKVGDKFTKFTRSRSFREPRSPEADKHGNGSVHHHINSNERCYYGGYMNPGMSRSISMSNQVQGSMDDSTIRNYNMQQAGNRMSLPPSYFETQTLPRQRGKRYGLNDDMRQRTGHQSVDNLDSSRSSQPDYLDSMFRKEREVYRSMQQQRQESSDENEDSNLKPRKCAKEYIDTLNQSTDSGSEGSDEISLPEVKRKEEADVNISSPINNLSPVLSEEPSKVENAADEINVTETHFPADNVDNDFTTEDVKESVQPDSNENIKVQNREKGSTQQTETTGNQKKETSPQLRETTNTQEKDFVAPPRHKKKIAPSQNFSFGQSPDKVENQPVDSNVRRRSRRERDRLRQQLYKQGGRRYTVQGLDYLQRQNSMDECVVDLRPQYPQEMYIPQDLVSVYRNMTKEELIHMVIQHKAQLIRKEQYMKDMEDYIDNLLVRVMEASPRLLQTSVPPQRRHWHP